MITIARRNSFFISSLFFVLINGEAYDPEKDNVYHLFTRDNADISQPLLPDSFNLLSASNFDPRRRTVILIHGGWGSVTANFNRVLVPAFLSVENVNVICVDWEVGAWSNNAVANSIKSGISVAMFINWMTSLSATTLAGYHIVGYGLGAHQAGVTGRFLGGKVPYITALSPSKITVNNHFIFGRDAALYTEAIHTSCGEISIGKPVAHADFYPNGGRFMPGCVDVDCDSERSFFYFSESLVNGGFAAQACPDYRSARFGICGSLETTMGGLFPKHNIRGVFFLKTNAFPPFSRSTL